jgi:hypothetical protein
MGLSMLLLSLLSPTNEIIATLGLGNVVSFIKSHFYATTTLTSLTVCSVCFLGIPVLFKYRVSEKRRIEIETFLAAMKTPLVPEEKGNAVEAAAQSVRIGRMAFYYGGFVALLLLIPNTLSSRLAILFCASFIGGTGWVLIVTGKTRKPTLPSASKPQS